MMDAQELAIERCHQFELHYPEYRRLLFRYAFRQTHNEAEAGEIADQTIFRYLKRMNKRRWEEDIQDVKAYLFTIAERLCFESWKRPREVGEVSDDDEEQNEQVRTALERKAMQENNPTSRLEDDIYYEEMFRSVPLHIILSGLSEYELRLLLMHAVHEMTPKEIAKALGESEEGIGYKLTKIYAKIRYRARQCM